MAAPHTDERLRDFESEARARLPLMTISFDVEHRSFAAGQPRRLERRRCSTKPLSCGDSLHAAAAVVLRSRREAPEPQKR